MALCFVYFACVSFGEINFEFTSTKERPCVTELSFRVPMYQYARIDDVRIKHGKRSPERWEALLVANGARGNSGPFPAFFRRIVLGSSPWAGKMWHAPWIHQWKDIFFELPRSKPPTAPLSRQVPPWSP